MLRGAPEDMIQRAIDALDRVIETGGLQLS